MPCNLAEVWMKRDLNAAYDYAMAMHDVGDGAFRGYETIQFASDYAQIAPPAEAVRLIRQILVSENNHASSSDLARTFICQGVQKTEILLQALSAMPAQERDGIAEYPLVMALSSRGALAAQQRMAALLIYGTRDGRLRDVKRFLTYEPAVRQEMLRHLTTLGYTPDELAAFGP